MWINRPGAGVEVTKKSGVYRISDRVAAAGRGGDRFKTRLAVPGSADGEDLYGHVVSSLLRQQEYEGYDDGQERR